MRKRHATKARLAASAARLAAERGLAATTVDLIAEDAQVGRSTFFRYFDGKENAVAEGVTGPWLATITDALARQPADLGPLDAVVAAFADLADAPPPDRDQLRDLGRLTRTSTTLKAWTLQTYQRYENAIAELIAPRVPADGPDPTARLVAAYVMAAVRVSLEDWLHHGGSLSGRIGKALGAISIRP
ncbi:TetR family transcriptional regulator [Actinocorallia sp. A-T 12471]|uniref:acyl-CoA-like ligand-binding transcription factor n=1 Tax=Actinocorallia sp. A-T 12471 TaxID=3089813 RepID=UPI0029CB1299|nr:TetR family transcriptional regulator [Actinocorallia sp. A-T 12471]MDX6740912.1 TetR family transcriptional regulator [Actinocorallia sp. A-T 12471]